MVVLIHVVLALASVAFATYLVFAPSKAKLTTSYGLIAATLVSGTYLVVATNAPLLKSCLSGLVYSVVAIGLSALAAKKLAARS